MERFFYLIICYHIRPKQPLNTRKIFLCSAAMLHFFILELVIFFIQQLSCKGKIAFFCLNLFLCGCVMCNVILIPLQKISLNPVNLPEIFCIYILLYCLRHPTNCNIASIIVHHAHMYCLRDSRVWVDLPMPLFAVKR